MTNKGILLLETVHLSSAMVCSAAERSHCCRPARPHATSEHHFHLRRPPPACLAYPPKRQVPAQRMFGRHVSGSCVTQYSTCGLQREPVLRLGGPTPGPPGVPMSRAVAAGASQVGSSLTGQRLAECRHETFGRRRRARAALEPPWLCLDQ